MTLRHGAAVTRGGAIAPPTVGVPLGPVRPADFLDLAPERGFGVRAALRCLASSLGARDTLSSRAPFQGAGSSLGPALGRGFTRGPPGAGRRRRRQTPGLDLFCEDLVHRGQGVEPRPIEDPATRLALHRCLGVTRGRHPGCEISSGEAPRRASRRALGRRVVPRQGGCQPGRDLLDEVYPGSRCRRDCGTRSRCEDAGVRYICTRWPLSRPRGSRASTREGCLQLEAPPASVLGFQCGWVGLARRCSVRVLLERTGAGSTQVAWRLLSPGPPGTSTGASTSRWRNR